jgi:hypothetical protein
VPHQADHRVLHRIFSFRVIAQRHARDPERPALDAGEESVERALPVHRFLPRFARAAERQWRIERSRAIHRFFPIGIRLRERPRCITLRGRGG